MISAVRKQKNNRSVWLKNLAPLNQPIRGKLQPIVTCLHAFSRAWRWLHVFASSSDWFIGLSPSVLIDLSNWFCFYDTQLKTALLCNFALIVRAPIDNSF